MTRGEQDKLWPFSRAAAFLAVPLIWLGLAICFSVTQTYLSWPDGDSKKIVTIAIIAAGSVPLILVLLEFLSSKGVSVSYKDWKLDFTRVDLGRIEVQKNTLSLPDNIGIPGSIITDSSPMNIIESLKKAAKYEVAIIDLKDGNAWWVTRLLALSAGAVRAQSPNALVFIGQNESRENQFLGWAQPADVLRAILKSNKDYKLRYERAMRISRQVLMYGANEFLPGNAPALPISLHYDVQRYTFSEQYVQLGDAVTEQILMDQLASQPSLEEHPERLTLVKLEDLCRHCLNRTAIERDSSREEQIKVFLESTAPYLALTREGKFESIFRRTDGERLIMRELFEQLQRTTLIKAPVAGTSSAVPEGFNR